MALASDLDGALRLARAIDQHVLAVEVSRKLRRSHHSMADLAEVIGERPETLAAKLRVRRPAPERDLILWSWPTGAVRTHPPLRELVELNDGDVGYELLPRLGIPARIRNRDDW